MEWTRDVAKACGKLIDLCNQSRLRHLCERPGCLRVIQGEGHGCSKGSRGYTGGCSKMSGVALGSKQVQQRERQIGGVIGKNVSSNTANLFRAICLCRISRQDS